MKELFFDIETSDLNAVMGHIFTIGYAFNKGPVHLLTIHQHPGKNLNDDSALLEAFRKVWEKADIAVAHYGVKFDLAFMQSRLLLHGKKILPAVSFVDTWWIAKHKTAFGSNSLFRLADALHVRAQKTTLSPQIWAAARIGDSKAMKYIGDHNIADVKVLREVAEKLRPLWENHPTLLPWKGDKCPLCGGDFRSEGIRPTATRTYRRLICKNCGTTRKGKLI